jgi:hypothetical protein
MQIAITAQESPTKTQEEFGDLKRTLTELSTMVREYSREIYSCVQIPMDRLLEEIYDLERKLAETFVLLRKPRTHSA